MKDVLKYLRGFEKECFLGPLFKLLEASFELLIPLVVASIVDKGISNADYRYVFGMCGIMIVLGVIGLIMAVSAQYFSAVAAVGFSARLRAAILDALLHLSYSQTDRLGTSAMITRMTSDINQVQNGVNLTLRLLLRSPFVVFGSTIMAFTIDPKAALIFVGVIPILTLIVFGIMLITMPMYKRVQNLLDGVTSIVRQNLTGVRVLRAFCKENSEVTDFEVQTESLTHAQTLVGRISALLNPLTLVVINVAVILLVNIGAIRVDVGVLTQGMVIALYNYMSQILVELIKLANLIISLTKAVTCGKRLGAVLNMVSDQKNGELSADDLKGAVEFENVTAQYAGSGHPSLENISFSVESGRVIGIIGGTGAGKTTLVHLISRFYDAKDGRVLIDGTDVSQFDMGSLRRNIGIVPQKPVLFQGTIRQNLLWGNSEATDAELWNALEVAQAREVVKSKAGELDAFVEQGGANFSGGQRQRLTIARALVRKPKILILDDCASALDYATDANLRMAIRNMPNPPTTFIISQRAASVRYADEILVLDDGLLVGKGSHEELLDRCPIYQEIYYSQFPKNEVQYG